MTVVLVVALLALLGVLIAGLPVLDRFVGALAERRAGDALAVPFGRPTEIRVNDRPFLTQALRGRYRSVRVSGDDLRIGDMAGVGLDAQLTNVYLSLRDLAGRRVTELPCEHLEGRLVLPYAELTRKANVAGLELRPSRGRLIATAALPLPGISQLARVSGMAVLELGEGNTVWLRVRGVSVAGINLPTVVLSQLMPTLEYPIPLPPLPYGLHIDEVRPGDDGLVVLGSAAAVVFRNLTPAPAPPHEPPRPRPRPAARPAEQDGRPAP